MIIIKLKSNNPPPPPTPPPPPPSVKSSAPRPGMPLPLPPVSLLHTSTGASDSTHSSSLGCFQKMSTRWSKSPFSSPLSLRIHDLNAHGGGGGDTHSIFAASHPAQQLVCCHSNCGGAPSSAACLCNGCHSWQRPIRSSHPFVAAVWRWRGRRWVGLRPHASASNRTPGSSVSVTQAPDWSRSFTFQ